MDTHCTSIQQAGERDTPCTSTLLAVETERDKPCTSTLRPAKRNTSSRPHCWWWTGKHLHVHSNDCRQEYIHPNVHTVGGTGIHPCVHTVDCGKRYNPYPQLLVVKGIHPHVYMLTIERDTLSRLSLQVVERDTPSCLHVDYRKGYTLISIPAGSGKGYTLMFTLLTIEWDTLSRLSLQLVERDTHLRSLCVTDDTPSCPHMLTVEMNTTSR
jgi:hypothetical protein